MNFATAFMARMVTLAQNGLDPRARSPYPYADYRRAPRSKRSGPNGGPGTITRGRLIRRWSVQ